VEENTMTQHLGEFLRSFFNLDVRQARYSEKGNWYDHLNRFPGALFDPQGYILFESEEEYQEYPGLQIGRELGVPRGISRLPGYRRLTEHGYLHAIRNRIIDISDAPERKFQPLTKADAPRAIDLPRSYHKNKRAQAYSRRLIRETITSKWVKYINEYKCQICGKTTHLGNSILYAETHHLQPVGKPHNGPDVFENILCVCPKHHVLLDFCAISLKKEQLRLIPEYDIESKYIDYHNSMKPEG
jgi:5-methylcytosine-specific restriction enzyme A